MRIDPYLRRRKQARAHGKSYQDEFFLKSNSIHHSSLLQFAQETTAHIAGSSTGIVSARRSLIGL
jgi:hypothetical protein